MRTLTLKLTMVLLCIALITISGCKHGTSTSVSTAPGVSQPIRVSSGDTNAAEPAIATAPGGEVYIAWVNHGAQSQADVMFARFNSEGRMQGSPVRVNSQPGVATAWRGDPPTVAVASDQTVYVGWTARVGSESDHATDIYLSSSRDHGQTFNAPVKVNDDPKPAVHGMHSLAVAKDGRVYLAWLDERNVAPMPMKDMKMEGASAGRHMESNREVFAASSNDGGRTFSTNQKVATNACPCCKTALAVGSDGRLFVSWRQVLPGDFRHIAVANSTDQGKTFTAPLIVSDDQWVLTGCPVSGAALSIASDGAVRALWYSEGKNGRTGLYWSRSSDQGATFGPRELLAAGAVRGTPVLIGDNGSLKAVWQDTENNGGRIMLAPVTTDGTAPGVLTGSGELPAAAASSGKVFVAYISKGTVGQDIWLVSVRG
jgi:hypothetical protein